MYERILRRTIGQRGWGQIEVFDVLGSDFKEVIATCDSFEAAKQIIDLEIREARACPSCED
jgi:hypothetical protein